MLRVELSSERLSQGSWIKRLEKDVVMYSLEMYLLQILESFEKG